MESSARLPFAVFKVIVNCGRCEEFIGNCLGSLRRQTVTGWQAFVTIDRRGDATLQRALEARDGDERIDIAVNRRRLYPMRNLVRAIDRCGAEPEDVIVVLDGDDWLIDDRALEIIAAAYEESDCWVTYGSWITDRRDYRDRHPPYPDDTIDFRESQWLGTAVRTWKKWLFDRIDRRDFRDEQGRWLRVTEDLACMFPLLEMATTRRARHIPEPLMFYNLGSHHDPGRRIASEAIRNAEWLRSRRRYEAVDGRMNLERRTQNEELRNGTEPGGSTSKFFILRSAF